MEDLYDFSGIYDEEFNFSILDGNFTFPEFPDFANMTPKIQPIQIAALTFYALVFLFGVPGNAIVVWVTGFKMPPSVPAIFFLNLALADLLCCLSLPLLMVPLAHDDHWHFGPMACTLVKGLFFLVMYCSILQLVFISLDRWLLVARPVWCQNKRGRKYAILGCVAVWCLALIASIPEFVYNKEINAGVHKRQCVAVHSVRSAWLVTTLRFLLGFLLPFLIIVICHLMVYRGADSSVGTRTKSRSKRMLKVITAVVLSFFLCWLPLHIVNFFVLVTPWHSPHSPSVYLAHVLTLCLAYFNSCLNPLLYVCLGRSFKDTMNRSLCNILHLLSEDHTLRTSNATAVTTSSSGKETTNV
ncbi:C5a anaphylatoxin chemotactic receptor 1-like [Vanacampus margaritifer]